MVSVRRWAHWCAALPTGTVIDRSNSLNVIALVSQLSTWAVMPSGTPLETVSASATRPEIAGSVLTTSTVSFEVICWAIRCVGRTRLL